MPLKWKFVASVSYYISSLECMQKNGFDTVSNICDTDNRAMLPYRLQPSVEITVIFCLLYYFLVYIKKFL